MTKGVYFEELSYALRKRELLHRGQLPVEWNGRILGRMEGNSVVRYDLGLVGTDRAKATLAQIT